MKTKTVKLSKKEIVKKRSLLWCIISEINSSQNLSTKVSRREPAQQVTVSWTLPGIREDDFASKIQRKTNSHFLFKLKITLQRESAQLNDGHLFINRSYQANNFQLPECCIEHELEILENSSNVT